MTAGPHVLLLCERLDMAGGVERFTCELASHFAQQGWNVAVGSVATPAAAVHYPLHVAVRVLQGVRPLPTGAGVFDLLRKQWRTGRTLAALVRAERPDVVLINGLTTAVSVLALLAWLPPGPAARGWLARCICCDHNHFGARSRPWQLARAWLYRHVAAVVSLSQADLPRFAAINPRTEVIYNASALRAQAPAEAAALQVLAVARHVAQKGLDLLLQAWADVQAQMPQARLLVLGDGPQRAALQAQAAALGVAGSVQWLPPTAGAEARLALQAHYRQAAVFVLPSRYEGMPLALLEAQALGVPAVAFDCPTGPAEILSHDTGVLVPAGDCPALAAALLRLLRDPALRLRMGQAAIDRSARHFSPQQHLQRWTALVQRVAAGTGDNLASGHASSPATTPAAETQPFSRQWVSIIVPCRNEAAYIQPFLDCALAQEVPEGMTLEVLVADGRSDDGTRALLDERARGDARLRVIDNPAGITSAALNLAIAAARGELIVRMDVHTVYASDYTRQCAVALRETGAACVGGPWQPVGQGWPQAAIAAAFGSRFGSGGAASRRLDYSGPADTVYLGAWPREQLLAAGGFDESLVRNQDDELALRITRAGGLVWQSAAIRSRYAPRASFMALYRQFHQYGYWKVPVIRKHRLPAAPRQLVPVAFVATLALLALAGIFWRPAWVALAAVVALYAAGALASAVAVAGGSVRQALGVAWACACMHIGYGLGFARGLLDFALLHRAPRASATRLTR